ncbi:uncharacterized protein MYCGRDRAFT_103675 [Zymoseptoria tritici IPO323]|uniref:Uncharacterized protein n=1 Tax=Zymoseptoria tritici (strain CBS 115943 / IPO323) TaxID=336722 RepID=F9X6U4_ZYMTI|nr:uncharacterized protein MYCGRDRAFT_103675 [Zymoseptoria tritici IPO323]EGP89453.1 hypothetical protein MYCGRDRAFT_103675 [Zymoseptoria tritici IPO323]
MLCPKTQSSTLCQRVSESSPPSVASLRISAWTSSSTRPMLKSLHLVPVASLECRTRPIPCTALPSAVSCRMARCSRFVTSTVSRPSHPAEAADDVIWPYALQGHCTLLWLSAPVFLWAHGQKYRVPAAIVVWQFRRVRRKSRSDHISPIGRCANSTS